MKQAINAMRLTPARKEILSILRKSSHAVSHGLLEQALMGKYDRVTLYRTLEFLEKNLMIHKIMDANGVACYAACDHDCESRNVHFDEHVHFHCTRCHSLVCLSQVQLPVVSLPKGFQPSSTHLLVEGVCKNCNGH